MRYFIFLTLLMLLFGQAASGPQEQTTDFSGKWKLNREQSDFGVGRDGKKRKPRFSRMTVEQDDKNLKVTIVRKNRDGKEQKTKMKYSLEGKKSKNKTDFGKQESTARWIEDGQGLEITSAMHVKRRDMEFDMESVQIWSLLEGRLVIESVRYTPRGDMETKAVYDRVTDDEEE